MPPSSGTRRTAARMPVRQLASHVHSAMYEWVQSYRESMPRRRKTRRRAIWPKHSTQARASSPHNHNLNKAIGRVRVRPPPTFELTGTSLLISGLFVLDPGSHRLSPIPPCRRLTFPSQLVGLPSLGRSTLQARVCSGLSILVGSRARWQQSSASLVLPPGPRLLPSSSLILSTSSTSITPMRRQDIEPTL